MRVLYIENGMHGGGSAESLFQLLGALDREHVDPQVLMTSPIPLQARLQSIDVSYDIFDDYFYSRPDNLWRQACFTLCNGLVAHVSRRFPSVLLAFERRFTGLLRRRLKSFLREQRIDLVHTNNNAYRDFWAIEAAAEAGVPCVSHLRSFHALGFNRHKATLVNRYVDAFVGYSQSILDFWEEEGLDSEKLHLVPNAIGDVHAKPVDITAEFGLPHGAQVIGIIGRVIPERGHEFLLRALPSVLERLPDLHLLVIGDIKEGDRRRLSELTNYLGIDDAVHWVGHQSNGKAIIAALDAIVLPYTIEPFGRTLLEAWRLYTPVVLSRVGHIEKIVDHDRNALLFDPTAPENLSAQLIRLLSDSSLADQLTTEGARVCNERFSVVAQARSIKAMYEDVLAKRAVS
ncbi:glycosyltransferase family 4 protein [Pseudomonadota bacterium]